MENNTPHPIDDNREFHWYQDIKLLIQHINFKKGDLNFKNMEISGGLFNYAPEMLKKPKKRIILFSKKY